MRKVLILGVLIMLLGSSGCIGGQAAEPTVDVESHVDVGGQSFAEWYNGHYQEYTVAEMKDTCTKCHDLKCNECHSYAGAPLIQGGGAASSSEEEETGEKEETGGETGAGETKETAMHPNCEDCHDPKSVTEVTSKHNRALTELSDMHDISKCDECHSVDQCSQCHKAPEGIS